MLLTFNPADVEEIEKKSKSLLEKQKTSLHGIWKNLEFLPSAVCWIDLLPNNPRPDMVGGPPLYSAI